MNFIFNPLISTLVITRNSDGKTLTDLLVRIGGFISVLWFAIMPFGKYMSRKLYDANLVASLYLSKDEPNTVVLSPEEIKVMEQS